jgi:hypothetical protein
MSDEDFAVAVGASGRVSGGGPGKHRGPRFTWNAQYEATFFRSLCESVSLGLRDGSTFKPQAWDRAMQALVDKHSAYANKSHLINKTDNARKKYRLWRGLREDPEFYYNAQTRTVSATDDAWSRHLQVGQTLKLSRDDSLTLFVLRKNHSPAPSAPAPSSTRSSTRSCFPTSSAPAAPPSA